MAKTFDVSKVTSQPLQDHATAWAFYIDNDGDVFVLKPGSSPTYAGSYKDKHFTDRIVEAAFMRAVLNQGTSSLSTPPGGSGSGTVLPTPTKPPPGSLGTPPGPPPGPSPPSGGGSPRLPTTAVYTPPAPSGKATMIPNRPAAMTQFEPLHPGDKTQLHSVGKKTGLDTTPDVLPVPEEKFNLPMPRNSPGGMQQGAASAQNLDLGNIKGADGVSKYVTGISANNLKGMAEGDPTAIINAIVEKISALGQSMGKFATSQRAGETISGAGGMMQHGGDLTGNPVLSTVGFATKVIGDSIEALRKWNQSLFDANMKFKEFSGAMAGVGARQEVRDILLSVERGERRGGTAEYHAAGKHELEKSLSKWEDLGANLQNLLGGAVSNLVASLTKVLDPTVDALNQAIEAWMRAMGYTQEDVQNWINDAELNLGEWSKEARPRDRF